MAKQTVAQLKAWFRKGLKPTEEQFAALLDSYVHKDDEIDINKVKGLVALLNKKYDQAAGEVLKARLAELEEVLGEVDQAIVQSHIAQQKEIDALKSEAIKEFAGVVYHESEASGKTVGEIYYAKAEGYFVEVTEDGIRKADAPYNKSDDVGGRYWGNPDLFYRIGADLYKLTEGGNMVKYALVSELTGGSGEVDLSGYLTIEEAEVKWSEIEEALGVLDQEIAQSDIAQQKEIDALKLERIREFAGVVYHQEEASGKAVGEIYYAVAEGYFVEVTEDGVHMASYPYNDSDSIGGSHWGNKELLYRKGTDLYKLTEEGNMERYALMTDLEALDTTGIKVAGSEAEIENLDNGQLAGVYAPDTRYSGKRLTEVGMAAADEDGYLIDAAGATAVRKITFAEGLNVDDEIELVFSCNGGDEGELKQVITLNGSNVTMTLWHKLAGELTREVISGAHYLGDDYYLVSYRRTGGDVTATASNFSAFVSEIGTWLGEAVTVSGGKAETLTHYTKTSKGLVEFVPMKVWRTNWRWLAAEEFSEVQLSADEYQQLSDANLVIIDGNIADKAMSETGISLSGIEYRMGNAITTRDYYITLQEDGTGKISVTSQNSVVIPAEGGALQLGTTLGELSQMAINVTKPFFVDVTLGKAYYTENGAQNDLSGIPLYLSQGDSHPQMAEIWHSFACKTEGRTRVKCEPITTELWEITVVYDNGVQHKQWLDLSGVTHIGMMSYTLDVSGYALPYIAEGVSIKIYQ